MRSTTPYVAPVPDASLDREERTVFWSVIIPTYDPTQTQLEQALRSALSQDRGRAAMEIAVVDDCSPNFDVESAVHGLAGDRVHYSRTSENKGLAGCWNTCISRARGEWIHILHQDDYVLPGFYEKIEEIARAHPDVGLIAVRSFFVDEDGVVTGVTPRIRSLENGGRSLEEFLYDNPLQFPGIVVRKSAYEKHGGFRSDLTYTLDWEMWARIVGEEGGVVSPSVLACYRVTTQNTTNRLARNGETLNDRTRLNRLFGERYKDFDRKIANQRTCEMALYHAQVFGRSGDKQAEQAHLKYWRRNAPMAVKARRYGGALYRGLKGLLSAPGLRKSS